MKSLAQQSFPSESETKRLISFASHDLLKCNTIVITAIWGATIKRFQARLDNRHSKYFARLCGVYCIRFNSVGPIGQRHRAIRLWVAANPSSDFSNKYQEMVELTKSATNQRSDLGNELAQRFPHLKLHPSTLQNHRIIYSRVCTCLQFSRSRIEDVRN